MRPAWCQRFDSSRNRSAASPSNVSAEVGDVAAKEETDAEGTEATEAAEEDEDEDADEDEDVEDNDEDGRAESTVSPLSLIHI